MAMNNTQTQAISHQSLGACTVSYRLIRLLVKDVEPEVLGRIKESRRPVPLPLKCIHFFKQLIRQPLDSQVLFHVLPLNGLGDSRDPSLDGPSKTKLAVGTVSPILS